MAAPGASSGRPTSPATGSDIATGDWRPLNLERPPFELPAPLRSIDERVPVEHGPYPDKRLALWRLDQR